MPSEKDVLLNEFNSDFPLILRTQSSINSIRNNSLRRNTPLPFSRYRKPNARLYVKNLWNTLVDMQWRWLLLTVAVVNVFAYVTCAILFYLDSWISGDFEDEADHQMCMVGIQNMRNFLMLGIETVTTVGYGYVRPTEYCRLYFVVLTFSTVTNILIDGAFISVVYAKLNRPKKGNIHGQILSKKAVISLRNGRLCLIVRVNDRDGKHWINSDVRMYFIKDLLTHEEEIVPNHMVELKIQPIGMLFWPVEVIHEIKQDSPLWNMSAKDLMTTRLEIVVVVSGSSVKTGQSTRSQTSYLNKEIMWGYQFNQCLDYDFGKREYLVDKKQFQNTVPQEVPLCSARSLAELQRQLNPRQSLGFDWLHTGERPEQRIMYFNEI